MSLPPGERAFCMAAMLYKLEADGGRKKDPATGEFIPTVNDAQQD